MDEILGTIKIFAFNWAPNGYLPCDGSTVNVQQYMALYSLLGIVYGGNGQSTFGLPDLRGQIPIGTGVSATDQHTYVFGKKGGQSSVTLNTTQIPVHNHQAAGSGSQVTAPVSISGKLQVAPNGTSASEPSPGGNVLADANLSGADPVNTYAPASSLGASPPTLAGLSFTGSNVTFTVPPPTVQIGNTGGGQPFPILPPYLPLLFAICVNGVYPDRP